MKARLAVILLSIMTLPIFISSCGNNEKKTKKTPTKQMPTADSLYAIDEKFNEAKQIIYSLPSPQEVSYILFQDNKKITFEQKLLNPLDNEPKYNSDFSKALNLGIYTADISYASIFEQNQLCINYIATAKKLAEQLGILNYFSDEKIKELEDNATNRDEVMRILTETYMQSDASLQENQQEDIGALVLIGGWIEGMYIAVNLTNCNVNDNPELVSSIMEQQLSLALLVDFLNYYKDNKLLSQVSGDIKELDQIFQNAETNINDLGIITVNPNDFKKICKKINEIRTKYITAS